MPSGSALPYCSCLSAKSGKVSLALQILKDITPVIQRYNHRAMRKPSFAAKVITKERVAFSLTQERGGESV
jgi:hypothetical protein